MAALDARELSDELAEELLAADSCIENASTAVTDKAYPGAEEAREWITDVFEALDESTHASGVRPSSAKRPLAVEVWDYRWIAGGAQVRLLSKGVRACSRHSAGI